MASLEERSTRFPEPPFLLQIGTLCREFGALPVDGGILDQPYVFLLLMREALREAEKIQEEERAKREAFVPGGIKEQLTQLKGGSLP